MMPAPELPEGLPAPVDDGACNHLVGMKMPAVDLISSSGRAVDATPNSAWVRHIATASFRRFSVHSWILLLYARIPG